VLVSAPEEKAAARSDLPDPASTEAHPTVDPGSPEEQHAVVRPHGRRRRRALLTVAAIAIGAAAGTFIGLRLASNGDEPVAQAPHTVTAPPTQQPAGATQTPSVTSAAKPPSSTAHPTNPPPAVALAGAGYVLGTNSGFRVSADRRSVSNFRISTRCGTGTVAAMPLTRPGRFEFRGHFTGRGAADVVVRGAFTSSVLARGTIQVRKGSCDTGPVAFAARLS
jgi:hypothetical protein